MATIVHKLEKEAWKRLHSMYESKFLHGGCFSIALALHQGLGWQISILYKKGFLQHAAVKDSDGRIFDIRGFVSEKEFGKPYGCKPPYDLRKAIPDDLHAIKKTHPLVIQRAQRIAEALWPELPWKNPAILDIITYADELEAFSRKHNKWIRIPPGTSAIQIQDGDGCEGGYDLYPREDGFGFTINCRLGA